MKKQAIVSSMFLGLTLPNFALASVPTSSSPSFLFQEQFNPLGSVELAQNYLDAQYVSSRLYSSKSQILDIARGYSDEVSWRNISVEIISEQLIKLNIFGKIPRKILRDPSIRVGLYLQRDSQGDFRFSQYDWEVWDGTCEFACENKVRSKLAKLPNEYPNFQQVLNNMLN